MASFTGFDHLVFNAWTRARPRARPPAPSPSGVDGPDAAFGSDVDWGGPEVVRAAPAPPPEPFGADVDWGGPEVVRAAAPRLGSGPTGASPPG